MRADPQQFHAYLFLIVAHDPAPRLQFDENYFRAPATALKNSNVG
jgi:hypothetical protein